MAIRRDDHIEEIQFTLATLRGADRSVFFSAIQAEA
jgi:hypothetical protein